MSVRPPFLIAPTLTAEAAAAAAAATAAAAAAATPLKASWDFLWLEPSVGPTWD